MAYIHTNNLHEGIDRIIDGFLTLAAEQRDMIEKKKETVGVDNLLTDQYLEIKSENPGLARHDDNLVDSVNRQISIKIDLVIAILAHCANPKEIDNVVRHTILLGRHNGHKINRQMVYPVLKQAFQNIDSELGIHQVNKNDRILVRRKTKAAISIINDCFSHKRSNLEENGLRGSI